MPCRTSFAGIVGSGLLAKYNATFSRPIAITFCSEAKILVAQIFEHLPRRSSGGAFLESDTRRLRCFSNLVLDENQQAIEAQRQGEAHQQYVNRATSSPPSRSIQISA